MIPCHNMAYICNTMVIWIKWSSELTSQINYIQYIVTCSIQLKQIKAIYIWRNQVQKALIIRTLFVSLCFFKKNVFITSSSYKCSFNQKNYLVQTPTKSLLTLVLLNIKHLIFKMQPITIKHS